MSQDKLYTVYAIQCMKTQRLYIGCTQDIESRIRSHFSDLKRGVKTCRAPHDKRANTVWQDEYNQYGEKSFKCFILEQNVTKADKPQVEQKYIEMYHAMDRRYGYNLTRAWNDPFDLVVGFPSSPVVPKATLARELS